MKGAIAGGSAAALSGIGLWILQVPLALAHAVIAGLLNFIPNVSPTLSIVLPMAIALLDVPWKAGAVLILLSITEMHDRLIVATAIVLENQGETVGLLTCDRNITASGL